GYPDQALERGHDGLTRAEELGHPFSLAFALHFAAMLHELRREEQAAQERAEDAIALSTEQGFPLWVAGGIILRGWAQTEWHPAPVARQKEGEIAQMHQGLAAWRATGAEVFRPHYLTLLAAAQEKAGQAAQGLAGLTEALEIGERTGERWWEAESYRLQGERLLALSQDDHAEAETCFHQALDIARRQQAK